MKVKICIHCGEKKSLACFYKDKSKKSGLSSWCMNCCKEYRQQNKEKINQRTATYQQTKRGKEVNKRGVKKYSLTPKGKEAAHRASKNYQFKYPKKYLARHKLKYAIKTGKIKRPNRCSDCNKKCKPEGHHPDYNKPLEVIWMCSQCHKNRHSSRGETRVYLLLDEFADGSHLEMVSGRRRHGFLQRIQNENK